VFFIIPEIFTLFAGATTHFWPQESIDQNMKNWRPPIEIIKQEIATRQGGWLTQMNFRVGMALFMQTFVFFWFVFWRVMSMMLLGMALFKTGVLTAQKSKTFYLGMAIIGIFAGYAISGLGVYENFKAGWEMVYSQFFGSMFNYFGSVFTALGYIGVVMLIAKSSSFAGFKIVLSSVGKMAFSNYIFMSLSGMFIFYGNGLGLFAQVGRAPQLLIVAGIWAIMLIISPLWLNHFRFGPLEWLWRSLTYLSFQAMKEPGKMTASTTFEKNA